MIKLIYPIEIAYLSSFLSIIIICAISSITSIHFFSEEVITHSLGEGFCIHKILLPQAIVIQFKTRSTTGVNVLGRIYENLIS